MPTKTQLSPTDCEAVNPVSASHQTLPQCAQGYWVFRAHPTNQARDPERLRKMASASIHSRSRRERWTCCGLRQVPARKGEGSNTA